MIDVERLLPVLGIVKARKHGRELWSSCPSRAHRDSSPSWSIVNNPNAKGHGFHYCFGCQFSGSALDLVMEVIDIPYRDALQWVTDHNLWLKGSLPLEVEVELRYPSRLKLRVPRLLLGGRLEDWSHIARDYALGRGLTPLQADRWGILYATQGQMAGRIVFPLKDQDGTWKSFHARTYVDSPKRYMNATEEDGFDPGAVFGIQHWPTSVQGRIGETVVLTEGTLSALACERVGAKYLCAIGGSELHERQVLKLTNWSRIICATDGDKAGDALAQSVVHKLASRCNVVRLPIPDKEDAASLKPEVLKEMFDACSV